MTSLVPQRVTSKRVAVRGTWLTYSEVGAGDPVLFLHGNPTSSFLWRNIIGPVAQSGRRCLALDLIGMGRSGKPDIDYRLADHVAFADAFVDALGLSDLTLVGHDWGAVIALNYARRFPGRVRGVAFLEGHIHPIASWDDMDEGSRQMFAQLRTPGVGERMVIEENFFIESVLPSGMLRTLSGAEMAAYREPYREKSARRPLWRWPLEIPIGGAPADVTEIVTANQAVIADSAPRNCCCTVTQAPSSGRPRSRGAASTAAPSQSWTSERARTSCRRTSRTRSPRLYAVGSRNSADPRRHMFRTERVHKAGHQLSRGGPRPR